MAICKVCNNDYAHSFQVVRNGNAATYDCFECAIHDMAPTCAHCQCRVIGHGIAVDEFVYCCAHCARQHGVTEVADNARHVPEPGSHTAFI